MLTAEYAHAINHSRLRNSPAPNPVTRITGMSLANAKSISHQDTRVGVERAAGKLLDLVAA